MTYAMHMIAEPSRKDRSDCARFSISACGTTLMPIQCANPTLPMTAPTSSAQKTNGMIATPMTEMARTRQIGPANSRTSSPVMNADTGVAASVVADARTGPWNTTLTNRLIRKNTAAIVHTHARPGTIGRPRSSPRVIHGTSPRSRVPSAALPMTM